MNGLLGQRKASRFAKAVDASVAGQTQQSSSDPELAKLVALTQELRALPSVSGPGEQFQARLRQRLLAVASVQGATESTQPRAEVNRFKKVATRLAGVPVAIAVGAFTLLQVTVGVSVAASANTKPGDFLYGVKRTTESLELALAKDDATKADRLMTFASRRVNEVSDLLKQAGTSGKAANPDDGVENVGIDSAVLRKAFSDIDKNTTEATSLVTNLAAEQHKTAPLETLLSWTKEQKVSLAALGDRLPADHATATVALLDQVSTRATALTKILVCTDCAPLTSTDQLGPIPCSGTCPSSNGGVSSTSGSSTPSPSGSGSAGTTNSPTHPPASSGPEIQLPPLPLPSQLPTQIGGPPEGGLLQPASPSQSVRFELPNIF